MKLCLAFFEMIFFEAKEEGGFVVMRLLRTNETLKNDLMERNLWREFRDRAEAAFAKNKTAGQCRASRVAIAEMAALGKVPMDWVDRVNLVGQPRRRTPKILESEHEVERLKKETTERLKKNEAAVRVVAASLEVDPSQGGVVDVVRSGAVDVEWENALGGKKINVVDDAVWAYVHLSCKSVSASAAPSAMAFQMYRDLKPLSPAQRLDVMKVIIGSAARKSDGEGKGDDEFRGTTEFNLLEEMAKVK